MGIAKFPKELSCILINDPLMILAVSKALQSVLGNAPKCIKILNYHLLRAPTDSAGKVGP